MVLEYGVKTIGANSIRQNVNLEKQKVMPKITTIELENFQADGTARHYLERVGLLGVEDCNLAYMSGSQQQRLAMGRELRSVEALLEDATNILLSPEGAHSDPA